MIKRKSVDVAGRVIFAINEIDACKRIGNMEMANRWWFLAAGIALYEKNEEVKFLVESEREQPGILDDVEEVYYDLYAIKVGGSRAVIPVPIALEENSFLAVMFERNVDGYVDKIRHCRGSVTLGEEEFAAACERQQETFVGFLRSMNNEGILSELERAGIVSEDEYKVEVKGTYVPNFLTYMAVEDDGQITVRTTGQPYEYVPGKWRSMSWGANHTRAGDMVVETFNGKGQENPFEVRPLKEGENFPNFEDRPEVKLEPVIVPEGEWYVYYGGRSATILDWGPGEEVAPYNGCYSAALLRIFKIGDKFQHVQEYCNSDSRTYYQYTVTKDGLEKEEMAPCDSGEGPFLKNVRPDPEIRIPFPKN
jgi:hypothetical protein